MVVAYYLGGRLGTSLIGLGKMVKNGTVERGEVGTRRNDVALLKIREPLLQKVGFYFITKTYAKAGRVLVCGGGRIRHNLQSSGRFTVMRERKR